jgi:hypothetical protein
MLIKIPSKCKFFLQQLLRDKNKMSKGWWSCLSLKSTRLASMKPWVQTPGLPKEKKKKSDICLFFPYRILILWGQEVPEGYLHFWNCLFLVFGRVSASLVSRMGESLVIPHCLIHFWCLLILNKHGKICLHKVVCNHDGTR